MAPIIYREPQQRIIPSFGVMETALSYYQEAINHLQYAYTAYGDLSIYSFSICFNLALSYIETGDMKRAAEFYHRAFKINPNDEGLTDLLVRMGSE